MHGILLLLVFWFLKPCDGYEVTCNVTVDTRGVLYSLPTFVGEQCSYSWMLEDHTVLANHLGENKELVVIQNSHSLLFKRCEVLIYYRRHCLSEKGPYMGTCNASCEKEDGKKELDPRACKQTDWGWIAFGSSVVLVLLVGVVLCYVFRARIHRGSCFYSALERGDIQSRRQSMEEGIPF